MKSIIATTLFGIIMMFAGFLLQDRKAAVRLALVLLAALLGINLWDLATMPPGYTMPIYNGMLRLDGGALWFSALMTGCTLLYAALVGKEILRVGSQVAEYFALIFFMLCGTYLLAGYHNLLMLFLGIEILSIPQYILAGTDKRNLKSSEASLKYFLMGSFSTGILLMGIALLYGASGSFYLQKLSLFTADTVSPIAIAGVLLVMVALAFKVSAAPFHLWTPDVYDGAPTPFTAFMATVGKAAAFFAFVRLFHTGLGSLSPRWTLVLAVVTALTLLIGNLTAVFQQSVKRMLAYSSIAQAGFMLFAVLSLNSAADEGIRLYAVVYTIATVGLFAVLLKMKDYTFDGFNGLARREPALAFMATIFLFSLVGIPLTGGFMAKYWVLRAAVQQGSLLWLVLFGLVMAAISAYYYFRVIIAMYFKNGAAELQSPVTRGDKWLLGLACALVVLLGVAPQILF